MIYRAMRQENGQTTVMVHRDENDSRGRPLVHISLHCTPDNPFDWGYEGSGPADLALAILAHYFGERQNQVKAYSNRSLIGYRGKGSIAFDYHQDFKRRTIARWERAGGQVSSNEIHTILAELMQERADERQSTALQAATK